LKRAEFASLQVPSFLVVLEIVSSQPDPPLAKPLLQGFGIVATITMPVEPRTPE
jgi:hypothetical protein